MKINGLENKAQQKAYKPELQDKLDSVWTQCLPE